MSLKKKLINLEPIQTQSSAAPDWEMSTRDWVAVLGASLGAFLAILDIQITNASLREIQGALGLDFSEGGWISTAYLIAEIIIIPLTAYFSKVFGMRAYMLFNCAFFIIASMLCGLSWNLPSAIVFRVLQGVSGGTLIPMAFQTLLLFMPPQKKNLGMAIFGMTATLAPTLGPSLGGWLTDNYGWRFNFFINILPGLVTYFAIRYGMPKSKIDLSRLKNIDLFGTATLILGLGTLTYILEDGAKVDWFDDFKIQVCFLISLAALPLFIASQLLRKKALLDLRLFKNRNFCIASVVTLITAIALYGGIYALSLYLGQVQDYSALAIGQVMMWVGIPQLFIMPFVPTLMKKVDLRLLAVVGMLLFAGSNLLNTNLNIDYAGVQFRNSLIIRALGQPLFIIPLSAIGMAMVLPSDAGNAASIYNVMRNLGGSIGIAITGTFVMSRQRLHLARHLEHISSYDFNTTERLEGMQHFLMATGSDPVTAKTQSTQLLVLIAQREALMESFSDIFRVLAIGLFVCTALIFFLKAPAKGTSVDTQVH